MSAPPFPSRCLPGCEADLGDAGVDNVTGATAGATGPARGTTPTSPGTGGGRSPASSAGTDTIAATTAAAIAATRPTLAHLICRPATLR